MKKSLYLFAIIFGCVSFSNAQVTFKPGIRGGLNMSHFSNGGESFYYDAYYYEESSNYRDFESKTGAYVGFFGDLKLSKFYSLQPEINLTKQGSRLNYRSNNQNFYRDYNLTYLSLGITNKFSIKKFNIQVGPTIDFIVDAKVKTNEVYYNNYPYYVNNQSSLSTDSDVDLAFFLGAGYDITKNFGLEARIKKGIIPVLDYSDGNHTNVVFSLGAYYKFDVK